MANDKTFPEVKTNPLTEAAKKRLSRSMMFVPGNTPKMINSADIHGSDSIMIDIEDSVPITEKDTARLLTAEALKSRKFRAETVVRINHPTQTPYGYDDLDVIVPAKPDMIRLPKTEDVSEVEIVAKKIEEVEKANGLSKEHPGNGAFPPQALLNSPGFLPFVDRMYRLLHFPHRADY